MPTPEARDGQVLRGPYRIAHQQRRACPAAAPLMHRCFPSPPPQLASFVTLALGILLVACAPEAPAPPAPERGDTLTVFAAASLTDVLTQISADYTERTGTTVRISFAASSTLAQQIRAGAPADLYVSADPAWMDRLESEGLIQPGSRHDLASNALVMIAPKDRGFEVRMEPAFPIAEAFSGRLAIGDPEFVPAGKYAREVLESLEWWDALEGRLITGTDVRHALRLVTLGEAAAGIVYSTDAASTDKVEVIGEFPEDAHEEIDYPVALVRGARPGAGDYLMTLLAPEAAAVLRSAGFKPVGSP